MYITKIEKIELTNDNQDEADNKPRSNESLLGENILQYKLTLTDTSYNTIDFTMLLHSDVTPYFINEQYGFIEPGECHFSQNSTFDANENVLGLTVFYRGINTEVLRRKVCTVIAKSAELSQSSKASNFQPNYLNLSVNYVISYPFLVYTYPTPNINSINIAHLQSKETQYTVNLRPYRLLQFVKTTRNNLYNDYHEHTFIYFLVENEQTKQVRLSFLIL